MTAPVAGYERRARRLENDAAGAAQAIYGPALAALARQLAVAYTNVAGSLTGPVPAQLREQLRERILALLADYASGFTIRTPALVRAIMDVARRGLAIGAGARGGRVSSQVHDRLEGLQRAVHAGVRDARRLARSINLGRYADVLAVLAKAHAPLHSGAAAAAWVANRSIADGVSSATTAAGERKLWIASRDACLACLAYSGQVSDADGMFQPGRTYGDKPVNAEPVESPPLHPNCRCRIVPYAGMAVDIGVSLPDALAREAQRSVLLGWSNYASRPAKMRAADRLLELGAPPNRAGRRTRTGLPQTVQVRARRKIAQGVSAYTPAGKAPHP